MQAISGIGASCKMSKYLIYLYDLLGHFSSIANSHRCFGSESPVWDCRDFNLRIVLLDFQFLVLAGIMAIRFVHKRHSRKFSGKICINKRNSSRVDNRLDICCRAFYSISSTFICAWNGRSFNRRVHEFSRFYGESIENPKSTFVYQTWYCKVCNVDSCHGNFCLWLCEVHDNQIVNRRDIRWMARFLNFLFAYSLHGIVFSKWYRKSLKHCSK